MSTMYTEIQSMAETMMAEHGLLKKGWAFQYDHARRRAGACHYSRKIITISKHFVQSAFPSEIKDTILHEIAHALVGARHGHNTIWRQKAIEIGCNGERCHQIEFSEAPWIKTCASRCWQQPAFRRNRRIHQYRCRKCGGKVLYLEASN